MSTRRSPTPKTSTRLSESVKNIVKNITSKFRVKPPKKYNTENQKELENLSVSKILNIDPSEISKRIDPAKVFPDDKIKRRALYNVFANKTVMKDVGTKEKMKGKENQINNFLFREGIRTPNSEEAVEFQTQTDKIVNETTSREKLKLLEQHTQNRVDILQSRKPTHTFSREQEQFIKKEALKGENPIFSKRKSNTRKKGGKGKPTPPQKMEVVKSSTKKVTKPTIKVITSYYAKDSPGITRKNMKEIKKNPRTGQITYHKDITVHKSEMDDLLSGFSKM